MSFLRGDDYRSCYQDPQWLEKAEFDRVVERRGFAKEVFEREQSERRRK